MAKNKVSEWSSVASNNTDIAGINIAEGCAPSGINNAIRELMAQVKDMQSGTDADNFAVGGNLTVTGTTTLSGNPTSSLQAATKQYVDTTAGASFPSGGIIMWSGSIASIPAGWYLCNGSNGTPDLRNRFIVGAGSTYSVAATGGSADAIAVSHTHTASTSSAGDHRHGLNAGNGGSLKILGVESSKVGGISNINSEVFYTSYNGYNIMEEAGSHSHSVTVNSAGSSGTNANLPPYYALAYIMKA